MAKARKYANSKGAIDGRLLSRNDIEYFTGGTTFLEHFSNTTIKNMLIGVANSQGYESYWMGTKYYDNNYPDAVYVFDGSSQEVVGIDYNSTYSAGIRPVITVFKSEVQPVS